MQPAAQLSPGLTCPNVPQPAPGYTVQHPNVKADILHFSFYLEPSGLVQKEPKKSTEPRLSHNLRHYITP